MDVSQVTPLRVASWAKGGLSVVTDLASSERAASFEVAAARVALQRHCFCGQRMCLCG